MEPYEQLFAIGMVILIAPFIHPLLVVFADFLQVIVPIGFVTIFLGVLLRISEKYSA
ncbi:MULTISPECIES: hypothetical protein [unclassified Haladaptatus]|uniref:hypothetical protein n=1 Tax=unclassified Haladaptatus TaxID=2622732 RepID=UPI0023E7F3E6|nr:MULTISPECIES: hypothetical protein [unclassified Haladaptatus]